MKLHELPYFQRLLAYQDRFVRLFERLNSENPSKAETLAHRLLQLAKDLSLDVQFPGVRPLVAAFNRKLASHLRDVARQGGLAYGMAMAVLMRHNGYFNNQHLSDLRRFISWIEIDCGDSDEVIEWLRDELDLFRCPDCDMWEFNDCSSNTYSEDDVCRDCLEENYIWLDRYDTYVHRDSVVRALDENGDEVSIHENDSDFAWNEGAGMRVHYDYEYEPPEPEVIGSYHSSKSRIRFQRDDWTKEHKRFLGVELEVELVDRYAERKDKARQLNELINEGDVGSKVFFENDGSLTNGFEVVTNPMSLPAHRELWKWLQDKSATKGLISHKGRDGNNSSCGLHVHVNRDSLTKLQIAKMVAFVNNPDNQEFMTALARRYGQAATGYCRIKADKAKVGKAASSSDRYEAVNVTPRHTIEFRIFRGTLKYESLVAAIEFVHALCEYTARCGDCSVSDLGYEAFLKFTETKLPKETQILRSYVNNKLEIA